jgi:hypothetical protein
MTEFSPVCSACLQNFLVSHYGEEIRIEAEKGVFNGKLVSSTTNEGKISLLIKDSQGKFCFIEMIQRVYFLQTHAEWVHN